MPISRNVVSISTALYYWLDGKRTRDPETGKPNESFDAVLRRLTGYDDSHNNRDKTRDGG